MEEKLEVLIERVTAALKLAGAREVYLFGSVVSGRMREGSDIDIAVSGLPPENFFKAMGEAGDILQRPLDLVDLDEVNPFTRYLKEEGDLRRVG